MRSVRVFFASGELWRRWAEETYSAIAVVTVPDLARPGVTGFSIPRDDDESEADHSALLASVARAVSENTGITGLTVDADSEVMVTLPDPASLSAESVQSGEYDDWRLAEALNGRR